MVASVPKDERLHELFRRLAELPPAATQGEAKAQIDGTLNAVEDELSGVPYDPDAWRTDGRMYPAQDDSAADVPGRPDLTSYRSRGHETLVRGNGAIEIREAKTKKVIFQKPGADGSGVW